MIINFQGGHITIDDNSITAQKIRDGYDFEYKDGEIKIKSIGADITNKWQAIKAIKNATTIVEVKSILIKLLESSEI